MYVLAEDYDFRVLLMLLVLLQPESEEIRCQIRVKFHFVALTPKNANSYVFLLESYDFSVLIRLTVNYAL